MQTRQAKTHSPKLAAKTAEPTQKAASSAGTPTRMPAWTSAWGDRPPVELFPQEVGNMPGLQAKLAVSQSDNPYEREADRVAEQVMRMPAAGTSTPQEHPSLICKENASADAAQGVPSIVSSVLNSGGGQPLDIGTRGFMESRFGHNFSQVLIHTNEKAATSARAVNAHAYTIGHNIVFRDGQFAPSTVEGKKLLAHELTHVIQQSELHNIETTGPNALTQHNMSGHLIQRDEEKSRHEWQKQLEEILPHKVGLIEEINRFLTLLDIFGEDRLSRLVNKIYQDKEARAFVQTNGVPGIIALADTQSGQGLDVAKAQKFLPFVSEKRATQEHSLKQTGELLKGASDWALEQARIQNIPTDVEARRTAVIGLDPKQKDNIVTAIKNLNDAIPFFEAGLKELGQVSSKLKHVIEQLRSAKKYSPSTDVEQRVEMKAELSRAGRLAEEALSALEGAKDHIDVYDVWLKVGSAMKMIRDISEGKVYDAYETIEAVIENLRQAEKKLGEIKDRYQKTPGSLRRIIFVLRSFLAINIPNFQDVPSAEEAKKFRGSLSLIQEDFEQVFSTASAFGTYDLFIEFATRLETQLEVREKMASAGTPSKLPIPAQDDVEAFFKALNKRPNDEVRDAYEKYASAYFFHKIVASREDLDVSTLEELFKQPTTISGTRPLVCTGYALLGAKLLSFAGASLNAFIVAVRVSDENLVSGNTLDDAHALAHMSRMGKTFFISNNNTVDNKEAGIGPDAVAWTNKDAPLFEASGKDLKTATSHIEERLQKEKRRAEARLRRKQR